ncbi:glycosyltransferase family 1 protein [Bailinhaonella thermotolerans]|uniref:Glycosyltransferase family 1 protein n=2 Tax=Bailinhaonella thermotolerans TaxID=1070861 RepID=A0A3A4BGZ9_9ACTN|nr:glycosyltransferase family 1 protein [Bailinhaonella thermotolerans]
MPPHVAAAVLAGIDEEAPHDLLVVRGRRVSAQLALAGRFAGRMWTYLTDVPQSLGDLTDGLRRELDMIARASRYLLCQTEELRCFLEQIVPATCGKSVLLPPIVPPPPPVVRTGHPVVRLVYTGKFAPAWKTLEMTGLPARLEAAGVAAELHMIGDKVHEHPPGYAREMRAALSGTPGVIWHGGQSREDTMRLAGGCDFGLSWRDESLDASLELSTKVLEYGALGLPVILNRTPMHEALLGSDYPLYAASEQDVAEAVRRATADPSVRRLAADRCESAARRFSLDEAARRLRSYLARAFPAPVRATPRATTAQAGQTARAGQVGQTAQAGQTVQAGQTARAAQVRAVPEVPAAPLKVAVAGHDLKFLTGVLEHLRAVPGLELRLDRWHALNRHDEAASREVRDWADVVLCEWAGPVAVWYSRHKRPGQRLLVRLHRFELYRRWPYQIDIGAVDAVICVSPHYARLTRERTGWPREKVVTVPNWVDVDQLDRPKLPGSQYRLGMIGIAPMRKRLDLALDVLAALRRRDPRYTLAVKSKLPWEYPWIWQRPEEREGFTACFERLRRDPLLDQAVVFDPFGPDVAAWLRRVGWVLSTSDDESFHLAPAEGMAAGAVPALLPWPGVDTIYDPRWVHEDPEAMAAAIAGIVEGGAWERESAEARRQVRDAYALDTVNALVLDLLTGRAPAPEAPRSSARPTVPAAS